MREQNIKTVLIDYSIAEPFADYIKKQHIKQITLVKETGLSKCYISFILNGKMEMSESLRSKLNAYLGTNF